VTEKPIADLEAPAAVLLDSSRCRSLRLQVYGFLARVFAGDLDDMPDGAAVAGAALGELQDLMPRGASGELPAPPAADLGRRDLESEYVRIFLNPEPGRAGALPYGSLYLESGKPRLMGAWAGEMERLLREEGLQIPAGGILLPDHAAVACEYLSHLIGRGLDPAVREDRSATGILLAKELSFIEGGFVEFMTGLRDAIVAADAPRLFRFAGELSAAQSGLDRLLLMEVFPHASQDG